MTIHEAVFSPVRQSLLTVLFLLMTAQMALLFAAFRDGRSRRFRFACLLHFLISFALFYPPMLDICWDINYPNGAAAPPAALSGVVSLPVWTLVLYEALTALILVAAFQNLSRYRKKHPTFESIKETMDLLPTGIAFGKADGTVVFSNLAANALSRALTGKALTDLSVFRQAAGATETASHIPLPDGSAVWQLTSKTLEVDGKPFTQLTATDITEQAAITRELEEKNRKLRDIHLRLDTYNKQADRIVIAQELLTARMAVHSEVGNVLLESRHYLTSPESFDEEKLLQALKNTNTYLLREYEEDDTARDALTDALEMAESIGVDVLISGQAPAKEPYRSVLAAAINECASNAVKHANGDRLFAAIRNTESELTYILETNGASPKEAVRETGGLLSLRALAEKYGGSMETAVSPCFTLTVRFPQGL